ncbi:hypothetical protein MMC25_007155 [Agyrium rufum]|nr:hypothetical protein [Agyrium rufum]
MASRGYDVVVDVDAEGDLGHTDLQEDLEFHSSTFESPNSRSNKPGPAPPSSSSNPFSAPSTSTFSRKSYLWSLTFYAQFFDVDTSTVLARCLRALNPHPLSLSFRNYNGGGGGAGANFLDTLDGNPDLYGPFWIATTVVFILFLTGTVSQYLAWKGEAHFAYDFTLLSGAAGIVYGYTFVIPFGLWAVLKWFGGQGNPPLGGGGPSTGESVSLMELWALYGYANLIWVPVALISWSPFPALNYVFVGVGFAISALFLVRNLWPAMGATEAKISRVLVIGVIVLHAALAVAIKFFFFKHGSPVPTKSSGGDDGKTIERMLGF